MASIKIETTFQDLSTDVIIKTMQKLQSSHTNETKCRKAIADIKLNFTRDMRDNFIYLLNDQEIIIGDLYEVQDSITNSYRKIIGERTIMIDRLIKKNVEFKKELLEVKYNLTKLEKEKKEREREQEREREREQKREKAIKQRIIKRKIYKFKLNPETKEFIPSTK